MVLIITDKNDLSSNEIIDWLTHYDVKYLKITAVNKLNLGWRYNDIVLKVDDKEYLFSMFKSYWYRRGSVKFVSKEFEINQINNFLELENKKLEEYFHYKLSKLHNINAYELSDVNKLIVSDRLL